MGWWDTCTEMRGGGAGRALATPTAPLRVCAALAESPGMWALGPFPGAAIHKRLAVSISLTL